MKLLEIDGIPVFGSADANAMAQIKDVQQKSVAVALMADNHMGYIMPIGGVAATVDTIAPMWVGVDIACGNAAVLTNLTGKDLGDLARRRGLARQIKRFVSFGPGRTNQMGDAPVDDALFSDAAWDIFPDWFRDPLRDMARAQLGTVGGGNHYVDVFTDEADRVWVGVHFGSRGFGFTIAQAYNAFLQGRTWETAATDEKTKAGVYKIKPLPESGDAFALHTPSGDDYWALMHIAGRYAYLGRKYVARLVAQILGSTRELDLVHNHHNFAWQEVHSIEGVYADVIVTRKGATPAWPGQRGFVGGSMGDNAVIIHGAQTGSVVVREAQDAALMSTVHGAGRVIGRKAAKKGKVIVDADGKVIGRDPSTMIKHIDMRNWIDAAGVVVEGGDVDESPQAYRRLPEVLAAQGATIVVEHTLTPKIVCMADARDRDPYKD